MHKILPTLALIGLIGAPVLVSAADAADVQKEAQEFVKKVSISNMFEIETSQVALTRSTDAEVKTYAQQMINDHNKAAADLQAAIGASGISLSLSTSLDNEHQNKLGELKSVNDKDFDEKYVNIQEDAHSEAVKVFNEYASKDVDESNAALRDFAIATLPALENHKTHAERLDTVK